MHFIPNVVNLHNDELAYSWYARMAKVNGVQSLSHFAFYYINPSYYNSGKMQGGIDYTFFSYTDNLCETLNTTAIDLYMKTSILPLYAPFLPISQQGRYINYILRPNYFHKLNTALNKLLLNIKVCPQCMKEEQKEYGYWYIHRSLQFPKINVCCKHHCALKVLEKVDKEEDYTVLNRFEKDHEYTAFCASFFNECFDTNIVEIKEAIFTRLHELGYKAGDYKKLINDIKQDGYDELFDFDIVRFLKITLIQKHNVTPEHCMSFLFYLFKSVDCLTDYLELENENEDIFNDNLDSGYRLVSDYRNDIVEIEHKLCNTKFLINPQFFLDGWNCPKCNELSTEDMFKKLFTNVGNGEYELLSDFEGLDIKIKVYHNKCDTTYFVKPRSFLYENVRCLCENRISFDEAKERIDSFKGFQLVDFQTTKEPIKVFHNKCGQTLEYDYLNFCKHPYCKYCNPQLKHNDNFVKRVYDLVGDEYTVLSSDIHSKKKVMIKHNKCGEISPYKPNYFLDGGRCKYCNRNITEEKFHETVKELSDGQFIVLKKETKNIYAIQNTKNQEIVYLTKAKTLQELTRITASIILPLVIQEKKTFVLPKTNEDKVWNYLLEHYSDNDIVFLEDIKIKDISYPLIKKNVNAIVEKGKLKSVYLGLYVFSQVTPDDDQLLSAKYIYRNGQHIGYYYGDSFAFSIGLLPEKPKRELIATNKEAERHGRNRSIFNKEIKLRASLFEVNNNNYKILPILDLGVNTVRYLTEDESSIKIIDYLKCNEIQYEDFTPYLNVVPDWIKNSLYNLYKKGLWK